MATTRLSPEAEAFIKEWLDPSPTVTAHTSGSTGKPKEISLLKADMRASARATISFFGLGSGSHLHLPLSPGYIAGKMQIVRALEARCSLTVEAPTNRPLATPGSLPGDLPGDLPGGKQRISLLPIVPSQIPGLLASPGLYLIDTIIIGGAPVSPEAEHQVISSGIRAYATYGMTETCSHVALRRLGTDTFTALPGFTFATDTRGCLTISSQTLSFGRLVTNDLIELDGDKQFRWKGRFDNVINSGGLKISPEQVEQAIAHLIPPGHNFYITSRQSRRWGQEAVMVCDLPPDAHHGLLGQITASIDHRLAPKDIIFDPHIEFTSSKKLIRRKF